MSAERPYRGVTHRDLLRWTICFVAMLSLHGAVAAALLRAPAEEGDTYDTTTAIEVDFTTESFKEAIARDVAPGEEQMQTDEAPPPQEKAEQKTEEKPEPEPPLPQVAEPDVALETPPEQKKEEEKKDEKEKTPNASPPLVAASATTAPTAAASRKAEMVSWKRRLALHLQRNKRYPREAQVRRESGTARVSFVVDRHGHIVSSKIVKGSGSQALDHETLELLQRAQPLPTPPSDIGGAQFAFTVPILFELK
ncbi:MAG: energy transducer TonB [Xanthobacteraceae bacterium]